MYLSSTEEKTKFTQDAAVQTIILAGAYLGAMLLAGAKVSMLGASPVNPAIAMNILIFNSTGDNWKTIFIFMLGPIGGSLLSLIFFRFVYQKTQDAMEEIEEAEEAENNALNDD
jgi:glycerol uptake facilitator-like aquaporin